MSERGSPSRSRSRSAGFAGSRSRSGSRRESRSRSRSEPRRDRSGSAERPKRRDSRSPMSDRRRHPVDRCCSSPPASAHIPLLRMLLCQHCDNLHPLLHQGGARAQQVSGSVRAQSVHHGARAGEGVRQVRPSGENPGEEAEIFGTYVCDVRWCWTVTLAAAVASPSSTTRTSRTPRRPGPR